MSWLHVLAVVVAIAAITVAAGVLAVWRDPQRLLLAEFARERIAAGFALRQATIDGCRWCYVERAAPSSQAPTLVLLEAVLLLMVKTRVATFSQPEALMVAWV